MKIRDIRSSHIAQQHHAYAHKRSPTPNHLHFHRSPPPNQPIPPGQSDDIGVPGQFSTVSPEASDGNLLKLWMPSLRVRGSSRRSVRSTVPHLSVLDYQ